MTVYCNITECINWLPVAEPHKMEHNPGFVPIGKTDEYIGRCAFESIKIKSTTAQGHSTKQVLAICGNFNSDESSESEEVTDEVAESEDTGSSNEENAEQSSDDVKEESPVEDVEDNKTEEENEEVKE